ncbi:MAG TPA: hypothetical protein DCZ01_06650 [Elusimicrobia bacterium]|nr:hypothetical protein [Elusimicrobiota bacterium]
MESTQRGRAMARTAVVDRVEKRYQMLVRFGQKLHGVVRLRPLLTLLADEVRRIVGAARCSIFLVDEARRELWTPVAQGLDARDLHLPLGQGLIGHVVAAGAAVRVADVYRDPRFNPAVDRHTGFKTRNVMAVPLKDRSGRTFGVFQALNKRQGLDFDAEDEGLLRILAGLAAAAVESARLYEELRDSHVETIQRLARTAEYRDAKDTAAHLRSIGRYSRLIARGFGLSDGEVESIECASPLHDIGKVGIRDAVLLKTGPLTAAETSEMRRHTSFGWEILSEAKSPLLRLAAEIAWAHHERFDGRGYPRGLKGGKIPPAARIVAVADVLDALTVERAYKRAWGFEESARYILNEGGRQFDPKVVAAFRRALEPLRQAWKERRSRAPGSR